MTTKVRATPTIKTAEEMAMPRNQIPIPADFDPCESASVSAQKFGVSRHTAWKWSRKLMRAGTLNNNL